MFGKSTPIGQRLHLFSERRQNVQKGGVKHLEGTVLVLFDTFFFSVCQRDQMQFVLGRKLLQSAPSPLYSLLFSMCLAVLNCFTLILGTKNLFFFQL